MEHAVDITMTQLLRADATALQQMNALLLQLSSRGYQMQPATLASLVRDEHNTVIVARDGATIVGMITLVALHQATGRKGYIEDLVVDERYRGRGLGKQLMLAALGRAKDLQLDSLEMKSETYRQDANAMYQKMGFNQKEANVYTVKVL